MKWLWLFGAIFWTFDAFQRVAEGGIWFWMDCLNALLWIANFQLTVMREERKERLHD